MFPINGTEHSFYEASITLLPKLGKETQENEPVSLMNTDTDAKILKH